MATLDAIAAAARQDWRGMVGISVAILALFGAGEAVHRIWRVPTEYTRKLAHVGGGAVVMTLPWTLSSHWTVLLLCLAFFGILVGGRVTGLLGSVHGVERTTGGAYFYPFAVYGSWLLSRGDALLFCVPMAVMAIADTGAAIVGKHAGETRYRVMDGMRSLEGSLTFFSLAFAIFLAGLAMDGRGGWPGVLLVALIGAVVTTCVEAISVRGADNLFIPYGGFLVLDRMLRLGLAEMGAWIEGMIVALAAVVLTWRFARMSPAGGLASFLFATLAWALGGPAWFGPLGALAVLLVLARDPGQALELEDVFPSLVGSVLVVLAFAHSGAGEAAMGWYLPFLVTAAANGAIGMAVVGRGRRWVPAAGLVGASTPTGAAWLWDHAVPVPLIVAAGLGGLALFLLLEHAPVPGRRLTASALAGLATRAALGG